ncbi:MAG TPA: SpoIIE family protein phosphatase [Bryobacteraceae bacterium]|nr:SpoIIE family protein phosphatase [Bryobacteraceae bacterium]
MAVSEFLKNRFTLARLFGVLLALFVIFEWVLRARGLATFLALLLVAIGAVLAVRIFRRALRQSIWRLRNRLIVTWVFIGVVPILLILALAVVGTWIVVGQVAVYLVSSELERRASSLADPVRILSQARPADRVNILPQMGGFLSARMPGLQIVVGGDQTLHYPSTSAIPAPAPGWKDYTGWIAKDSVFYSAVVAKAGGTTVVALAPVSPDVMEKAIPGIGALNLSTGLLEDMPVNNGTAGSVPPAWNGWDWVDFPVQWLNSIPFRDWASPDSSRTALLSVTTRPSAVLGAVFSKGIEFGQAALLLFDVLAVALLSVWLISIIIGLSLTRSITRAVHNLYEATLQIAKGDFSGRISLKGNDQLADLGGSFNNMTAQIEHLVLIAREKERLESEVEIASEVQNQLFPRSAPAMQTIELIGICHPARMVSGDYYDYLCLPDGNLAVAIGDVAGKGISAALLMASIQSIVRTQLAAGIPVAAAVGNGHAGACFSTSSLVAQLNRQLYANTSPEKYATFFFGVYDEHSRILTYTNAGHVPPLLLRGGEAKPLEVTGTVVGAFPSIRYEEQRVEIQPNDLLVAYTDGITEPENAYGEEFGYERLAETALLYQNREPKEIVGKIMEAVLQWSVAPELPDDMTVVIARGRA